MNLFCIILFNLLLTYGNNIILSASANCVYNFNKRYACKYECEFTFNDNLHEVITHINGDHLEGFTNQNVQALYRHYEKRLNSPIFPSIICNLFPNLEIIEFQNVGYTKLDENLIENCRNLEQLDLYSNEMKKIPKYFFASNSQLKSLSLSRDELDELPAGIFDSLVNLEKLYLHENQLQSLPLKLFDKTTQLNALFLNRNQLKELPFGIFTSLINLEYLSITLNRIKTLDSRSFGVLPKLRVFNFRSEYIDAVDERIIDDNLALMEMGVRSKCANYSIVSYDSFENRSLMKDALKKCFENYKIIQAIS